MSDNTNCFNVYFETNLFETIWHKICARSLIELIILVIWGLISKNYFNFSELNLKIILYHSSFVCDK